MSLIKTEAVCRDFQIGSQTVKALKNITIDIKEGSLTILKGRSGSGKTTLINILGVIDLPSRGHVMIRDKATDSMSEREKNELRQGFFGYVFQAGALIPNLTVGENIELPLRLAKLPRQQRKQRVEECLTKVGLIKKLQHYPEELSGGELQRAGIARAIVNRPKVIFADEPTSALDYTTGLRIVKLFKDLITDDGITLIMSTHDPKLVPLASCVYNLKDGEIVNE